MNPSEFTTLARNEEELWWFRGLRRILFDLLHPLVEKQRAADRIFTRVLEAGSGTGYMAKILHERYGWPMFPTEPAPEGISLTPRSEGLFPVQADIGACPFPDGIFDAVLSFDVLVHFPRGQEVYPLQELARILRPGGLLVVRVSHSTSSAAAIRSFATNSSVLPATPDPACTGKRV